MGGDVMAQTAQLGDKPTIEQVLGLIKSTIDNFINGFFKIIRWIWIRFRALEMSDNRIADIVIVQHGIKVTRIQNPSVRRHEVR